MTLGVSFTDFCCCLGVESPVVFRDLEREELTLVSVMHLLFQLLSCCINQVHVSQPHICPSNWSGTSPCQALPGRFCHAARLARGRLQAWRGERRREGLVFPSCFLAVRLRHPRSVVAFSLSSGSWFKSSFFLHTSRTSHSMPHQRSRPQLAGQGPLLRRLHPNSMGLLLQAAERPAPVQQCPSSECSPAPCS